MKYSSSYVPGYDGEGLPVLSVLAKSTFELRNGTVRPSDHLIPLQMNDIYADQASPRSSDLISECDLVPYKPCTDIIVCGYLWTPKGKRMRELEGRVRVGAVEKRIRALGTRKLKRGVFGRAILTDPEMFENVKLLYKNAYGGVMQTSRGIPFPYPFNPIGMGFTFRSAAASEVPLPLLEDPDHPLTSDSAILSSPESWLEGTRPCSLGWTRRDFYPRGASAGVSGYPTTAAGSSSALRNKTGSVHQGASEGLGSSVLNGGEEVFLENLDKHNPLYTFTLPQERPSIILDIGKGPETLVPVLQTVVIDKEKDILTTLWRGGLRYGGIETLGTFPVVYSVN